jgi:hypothetical protein
VPAAAAACSSSSPMARRRGDLDVLRWSCCRAAAAEASNWAAMPTRYWPGWQHGLPPLLLPSWCNRFLVVGTMAAAT